MKVSIYLSSPYDHLNLGDKQLGEWNFGIPVPEVGDTLDLMMDAERITCVVKSRTFHAHESDGDGREDRTVRSLSMVVVETNSSLSVRMEREMKREQAQKASGKKRS